MQKFTAVKQVLVSSEFGPTDLCVLFATFHMMFNWKAAIEIVYNSEAD